MGFTNDLALAVPKATPDQEAADLWHVEAMDVKCRDFSLLGSYPSEAEALAAACAALAGVWRWAWANVTNAAYRRWRDGPHPRGPQPADARCSCLEPEYAAGPSRVAAPQVQPSPLTDGTAEATARALLKRLGGEGAARVRDELTRLLPELVTDLGAGGGNKDAVA